MKIFIIKIRNALCKLCGCTSSDQGRSTREALVASPRLSHAAVQSSAGVALPTDWSAPDDPDDVIRRYLIGVAARRCPQNVGAEFVRGVMDLVKAARRERPRFADDLVSALVRRDSGAESRLVLG